ncbi:MAG TPA: hypothetical protein VMW42_12030 [Desulfatiglandales bacterium]|nr:hypothetical protein [Desulfatiglandales bacterium]
MSDNEKKAAKRPFVSEAVIIACSPLIAYFLTFIYEAGFAGVYKIPLSLVELNLTTVFTMAVAVATILFFVLMFFNPVYIFAVGPFRGKEYINTRIAALVPILILFLANLLLFGALWKKWIFSLIFLIVMTSVVFFLPLITQRSKESYLEKIKADAESYEPEDLYGLLAKHLGRSYFYYLFCFFMFFLIVYSAGQAKAMKEKEFLVLASSPDTVVLRIYGDNIICSPFNRGTKEVQRSFIIHKVGETPPLELRLEKIGPLVLKK